jgi:polar amino acid transport system substrate-binding protein
VNNTLRVGAAFPDPAFNNMNGDGGLDISVVRAIGEELRLDVDFVRYRGRDFDAIFDRLDAGDYGCVTSGTTVTPDRERLAAFCEPYLVSGQSLAVNVDRHPHVRSADDLAGLTIGVQRSNTSQPIANRLVAQGKAGAVRVYDYGMIKTAIDDVAAGRCDAFMKLGPVLTEVVRSVGGVQVVQRGISTERIAIAVRREDAVMLRRLNAAAARLQEDGRLSQFRLKWLGSAPLDQSASKQPG